MVSMKRRKASFAGDVLKLVSGTTFAQLLAILAAPVLTRLYAPDAFGILALFSSITGILGVIACLRYESRSCCRKRMKKRLICWA